MNDFGLAGRTDGILRKLRQERGVQCHGPESYEAQERVGFLPVWAHWQRVSVYFGLGPFDSAALRSG